MDLFRGWAWPKKYMPRDKSIQLDALEASEDKFNSMFVANAPMHFQQIDINVNNMGSPIGTWPNKQQQAVLRGWILDYCIQVENTQNVNIGVTAYVDDKNTGLTTWYPMRRYVKAGQHQEFRETVTGLCIPLKPGTFFKGINAVVADNSSYIYFTPFYNIIEAI